MSKKKISPQAFIYPMPMCMVSTEVGGKVNHLTIAWITRTNLSPPMLGAALNKNHYSNQGIRENRAFGLSFPTIDQLRAVDHVGLVSGARSDKSQMFEVFYGSVEHAPMISACPYTLACKLVQIVDLPTHELFIGEIVEAYCDGEVLTDGKPDIGKMQPFTLTMPDNRYWSVGQCIGKAWSDGKGYRP